MATEVAMESEDIISEIYYLIDDCSKSEDLYKKIEEKLNVEELQRLLNILKKIEPVPKIKKKKKEISKKLNEKENNFMKINLELESLKSTPPDIHFDTTIDSCNVINSELKKIETPLVDDMYSYFNKSLNAIEKNGIQCSMIVAKLRYEMFDKYRRDHNNCRIEQVHAMFNISPRTYTYYNTFYRLITEYPQLLRMGLAWSIVAKYKLFILSSLNKDPDLKYLCEKPYNPFANLPDAPIPRPRTVST